MLSKGRAGRESAFGGGGVFGELTVLPEAPGLAGTSGQEGLCETDVYRGL
jgi:hypothetical protein